MWVWDVPREGNPHPPGELLQGSAPPWKEALPHVEVELLVLEFMGTDPCPGAWHTL